MRRAAGFSLLELLVALGILGALMLAVNSLQTGTLDISTRVNSEADRYRELTDATGFISDVIRQADHVYSSVVLSTDNTLVPSAAQLSAAACAIPPVGSNPPCFAVRIPLSESSTSNLITGYRYYAFRFVARSSLPTGTSGWKVDETWLDANTYAIVAYSCTTLNSGTPSDACGLTGTGAGVTAITGMRAALVTEDLTYANYPSGTVTPFSYDSGTKQFTLQLRTAFRHSGTTRYVPGDRAYEVRVLSRNR